MTTQTEAIRITGQTTESQSRILTPEAIDFLLALHARFEPVRQARLQERKERQARLDAGEKPKFLEATRATREAEWTVAPIPADLRDRRVEITGPTDRKMIINALNSGASVFMADFEDSNSPTWENCIEGQRNLCDAVRRTIEFTSPEGKEYKLNPNPAVLFVRPRGWHLEERHMLIDGQVMSGSLFDFGLADMRDHLVDKLEAANYPVADVEVVEIGDDILEIVATLVASSVDPNELNAVAVEMQRQAGVRHATWEVSTTD